MDISKIKTDINTAITNYGIQVTFTRLGAKLGKAYIVFIKNEETEQNLTSMTTRTFLVANKMKWVPMVGDDVQIGKESAHIMSVEFYAPNNETLAYKVVIG